MMKDSLNTEAIHKLFRICQRLIAICCCFLMFSSVAGVFFGGVPLVEKYAYIGQAVELVSNINSHYEDPTLYGENGTYLASWKGNTSQPSDCQYEGKFHMDDKRNIWILRVEREDAGKYSVKFGAKHKRHEVHIRLTVKEECPDVPKEGSSNSLIIVIGLVSAILVIVILDKVLTNKDWIRKRLKAGKNWIQEKLGRKQLSKSHENTGAVATIDGSDKTKAKRLKLSTTIESIPPRTDCNDTLPSTSRDEQNSNQASQSTARNMKSSDSESSDEREVFLH